MIGGLILGVNALLLLLLLYLAATRAKLGENVKKARVVSDGVR